MIKHSSTNFKVLIAVLFSIGLFVVVGKLHYYLEPPSENYLPEENNIEAVTKTSIESTETTDTTQTNTKTSQNTTKELPNKYLLKVPFVPQAPLADWSEPYENACEEASIIMIKNYLLGETLSREEMKSEIDTSVNWQLNNWGTHADLNAEKTLLLAREHFTLSGQTFLNADTNLIKKLIVNNSPVVIPTAGRKLGNPNFRGAGPEYHMLVVVGFDDTQGIFITNDPGTRKGENYVYKYEILVNAISGPHENMEKSVLVLSN